MTTRALALSKEQAVAELEALDRLRAARDFLDRVVIGDIEPTPQALEVIAQLVRRSAQFISLATEAA